MKVAIAAGVLLGVLALAFAAYEIGRREGMTVDAREKRFLSSAETRAPAASSTEADAARQREAILRLQIQRLEQRLDRLDAARDSGAPQPKASEAVDDSAHPAAQTPSEYQAAREAALQASEANFRSANGSSDWGRRLEAGYLLHPPKSGRVRSVACRAEICRVEVVHDSAQDAERFVDETETDPLFMNTTIRWFTTNPEKTHRVLFVQPAKHTPTVQP
ncbi:MAG TPA: hypothetical protein VG937_32880 [Polyangiaceae bacterium]|nr:hypothetical protein [Polyangiaceae bacterium]